MTSRRTTAACRRGTHTVCTVHGLNWKVDKWGGFASAYLRLGERVAAKYADDLVVLSESE